MDVQEVIAIKTEGNAGIRVMYAMHVISVKRRGGAEGVFEMWENKKDAKEGLLAAFLIKIRRFLSCRSYKK